MLNPSARQLSILKVILFIVLLIPFGQMAYGIATNNLGANPVQALTWQTGEWTLYMLTLTLAVTPLRRLTGWNWVVKYRRMIGLYAFFYVLLHFTTFFWFDHFFNIADMLTDVARRPFILVGFMAFILMIPLAVTSTNGMVRRLGGKNWQRLHKLVYLIAGLGLLHFWWMRAGKHNFAKPSLFIAITAVLLAFRIVWYVRKRHQDQIKARAAVTRKTG